MKENHLNSTITTSVSAKGKRDSDRSDSSRVITKSVKDKMKGDGRTIHPTHQTKQTHTQSEPQGNTTHKLTVQNSKTEKIMNNFEVNQSKKDVTHPIDHKTPLNVTRHSDKHINEHFNESTYQHIKQNNEQNNYTSSNTTSSNTTSSNTTSSNTTSSNTTTSNITPYNTTTTYDVMKQKKYIK
jgi:hypothetical protein